MVRLVALLAICGRAIERSDYIGFEFDDELLNCVLDAFALTGRNVDGAVVFTGRQSSPYPRKTESSATCFSQTQWMARHRIFPAALHKKAHPSMARGTFTVQHNRPFGQEPKLAPPKPAGFAQTEQMSMAAKAMSAIKSVMP
jgi:hypothetical protein